MPACHRIRQEERRTALAWENKTQHRALQHNHKTQMTHKLQLPQKPPPALDSARSQDALVPQPPAPAKTRMPHRIRLTSASCPDVPAADHGIGVQSRTRQTHLQPSKTTATQLNLSEPRGSAPEHKHPHLSKNNHKRHTVTRGKDQMQRNMPVQLQTQAVFANAPRKFCSVFLVLQNKVCHVTICVFTHVRLTGRARPHALTTALCIHSAEYLVQSHSLTVSSELDAKEVPGRCNAYACYVCMHRYHSGPSVPIVRSSTRRQRAINSVIAKRFEASLSRRSSTVSRNTPRRRSSAREPSAPASHGRGCSPKICAMICRPQAPLAAQEYHQFGTYPCACLVSPNCAFRRLAFKPVSTVC